MKTEEPIKESRYKVNIIHRGKERWKYCRTIERAKYLQAFAEHCDGFSSIIYQKINGKYLPLPSPPKN